MKPLAALAKGICLFCAIFAAQAMAFADVAERTAPLPAAEVLIINSLKMRKRASVYACIANISTMNAILPEVWITNS